MPRRREQPTTDPRKEATTMSQRPLALGAGSGGLIRPSVGFLAALALVAVAAPAAAQTVAQPIVIELQPLQPQVAAGDDSALLLRFKIPNGFWLGADDPAARIPPGTIVQPRPQPYVMFGEARFPEPEVRSVPVHLGTTRVFEGEIQVIVPFHVAEDAPTGRHELVLEITYTPGLNAGHLHTHAREPYAAEIEVVQAGQARAAGLPQPAKTSVPADFLVQPRGQHLPQPFKTMFHHWSEDSGVAKFFHRLFLDSGAHGKHIRTVWHPATGSSKNTGESIGLGVSMMDVTREGIMTGMFDVSVFHNEYAGTTGTFDLISCPCAYFNYHLRGEFSADRNRQVHLHVENMNLGARNRFGIEFQVDAFQDPRYRFYGLGGDTQEEAGSNYAHEEFGGFVDVYWLPVEHFRFSLGAKVRSVDVKRGAKRLAGILPQTIAVPAFADVPGIRGATVVGERLNIVYDARNQEFTPSAGTYAKFTAEFDQVTSDAAPVSRYGRFALDLRKYYSTVDQKYTLLLRNVWTFTTSRRIPFFDQATLGGAQSLRGFDVGRFYGQHAVFASAELRMQVLHMFVLGSPMDVEMSPFIDVGQVFDSDGFDGEFNVNPGVSLRMLNRPNIGFILNVAGGQDGALVSGGLSLPF